MTERPADAVLMLLVAMLHRRAALWHMQQQSPAPWASGPAWSQVNEFVHGLGSIAAGVSCKARRSCMLGCLMHVAEGCSAGRGATDTSQTHVPAAAGSDADMSVFRGHELHRVATNDTLTFEHTYTWWGHRRKLRVTAQPEVTLAAAHVPRHCRRARVVLLGPLTPQDMDSASFVRMRTGAGRPAELCAVLS